MYPAIAIDNLIEGALKKTLSKQRAEEIGNSIGYKLPYVAATLAGPSALYLAKYGITKYRMLIKTTTETNKN